MLNDISRPDIGFDAAENEVTIVTAGAEHSVPKGPKSAVAATILDRVQTLRSEAREVTGR